MKIPFITHSYESVPASDEETLLASPENKEATLTFAKYTLFLDPSFWLTTFAALSIALTIRNLLVVQLQSQESRVSYVEASIGSPYNGLEKLVRNESSPSWPLSSTRYPDFIGATEGPYVDHSLKNGSIVRLDSERTIVIQHRVRDYKLERCALKLRFSHSADQVHEHTTREYGHVGSDPHLAVWRLEGFDSKAVLASSGLPVSLPARQELLGSIALKDTRSLQSSFFGCSAGSILTLEIAVTCTSDPCIVEFLLQQSPQRQGFWIVQSE